MCAGVVHSAHTPGVDHFRLSCSIMWPGRSILTGMCVCLVVIMVVTVNVLQELVVTTTSTTLFSLGLQWSAADKT